MTEDVPDGQQEPRPELPEKKYLMIALIVVALLIIAVIVVIFIQVPSGSGNAMPAAIKNNTSPENAVSSSGTPKITKSIRPAVQTPTITRTPQVPVDFILQSQNPSSCGLTCRQLNASITNTGYTTAHAVCIEVSMHNSRNEIINLNGAPSLSRCIGDIAGGQTITESITMNADCGLFATKCLKETLTVQTRVTSVEKTVQFPDQLIAV